MNVKANKLDKNVLLLEATASKQETRKAFEVAELAFATQMGVPLDTEQSIALLVMEKFGIEDLDTMLEQQVFDYLIPFALDEKGIMPNFPPRIVKRSQVQREAECSFQLEVTLKPEYELSSYEPVTIQIPSFEISEEALNQQIAEMAESYADFIAITPRPAHLTDNCLLTIRARHESAEVPELNVDNGIYTLGSKMFGQKFDKHVLGMKVGETKVFSMDYPENGSLEMSRNIEFTVSLLDVRERVVPVINDTWIKENLTPLTSVNEFKELLRQEFKKSYAGDFNDMKRQLASQELAKRFNGDIDDKAFDAMKETLINNLRMQLQRQGKPFDEYVKEQGGDQQFNLAIMLQAREALMQGYSLDALFRHNKMVITAEDVLRACKTIDPDQPELVKKQIELAGCGFTLRETAQRLKASAWLVENAIIEEESQGSL